MSLLCLVESSLRSNQQIAINAKKIRQAPAFAAIDLSFLNDKQAYLMKATYKDTFIGGFRRNKLIYFERRKLNEEKYKRG